VAASSTAAVRSLLKHSRHVLEKQSVTPMTRTSCPLAASALRQSTAASSFYRCAQMHLSNLLVTPRPHRVEVALRGRQKCQCLEKTKESMFVVLSVAKQWVLVGERSKA
jgi:hypothetical protein